MFSVEKTDLFNILKRTKGVLIKHSIQPVLGCYKIDVANKTIVAQNNEINKLRGIYTGTQGEIKSQNSRGIDGGDIID